jgi:hypothetical protein
MRRQIDTDRVYRVIETYDFIINGMATPRRSVMGPYLKIGAAKGVRTNQINMYNLWHDPNNPRSVTQNRSPMVSYHNYECYIEISDPLVWTRV